MFKAISLLIAFSFLTISYNAFAVDIEIERQKAPIDTCIYPEFDHFTTAIFMMQPEESYNTFSDEQKRIAEVFPMLKNNNYSKVKESLKQTMNSNDTLVAMMARDYLGLFYLHNNEYSNYGNLYDNKSYIGLEEENGLKQTEISNSTNENIEIEISKDLILIPIKIKGNTYKFLFDSGTDKTTIKRSIANELEAKKIEIPASLESSSNEIDLSYITEFDNISIGNIEISNPDLAVLDDELLNIRGGIFSGNLDIDGIIGWDLIREFDYIIDIENDEITINPEYKSELDKNFFWLGSPFIRLKIGQGYEFNYFFDSGSYQTTITDMFAMKTGIEADDVETIKYQSLGGEKEYQSYVFNEIELWLGFHKITFEDINTNETNRFGNTIFDGVLGADFLETSKIYFSPRNGIMEILEVY